MALGQISLDRDSKQLLQRIAGALEKIADGSTKEQVQFTQYISGGEAGLEEGFSYVVRLTGCTEDTAARIIEQMVNDSVLGPGEQIEVSKR